MDQRKGFFAALFDLSFTEFVTTMMIKFLFVICILIAGIMALVAIFYGFNLGALVGFVSLIISPILFLLYVLISRIWLELIIVVFRIAENTTELVRQGNGGSTSTQGPSM